MDIIDVAVARALSSQGQIETYAQMAQQAVTKANTAVSNIETITEQTNANNELAAQVAEQIQTTLSDLQDAIDNLDTSVVTDEIKKLTIAVTTDETSSNSSNNIVVTYPDGTTTSANAVKYYKSTGNNADGTMTQQAITQALASISGGGSGSSIRFDPANAGQLVAINNIGGLDPYGISAEKLALFLLSNDTESLVGTVGLQIDYANKLTKRIQDVSDGAYYTTDTDSTFYKYSMFGGRKRCIVDDSGAILAFEGQSGYDVSGARGQVMVYQPKFYYSRIPITVEGTTNGQKILKENIILSETARPGFSVHPLFINTLGHEVDYVLLPAFQGCTFDVSTNTYNTNDSYDVNFSEDKLSSVAYVKPVSGLNKTLTVYTAEQLAQNRGRNWHITNIQAESANQMLAMVEFGSLNGQQAVESGVVSITSVNNANCASLTGSTVAGSRTTEITINDINGQQTSYSENGKRAVCYRGMENPWGNIWRYIGGLRVEYGQRGTGGTACINTDYTSTNNTDVYTDLAFHLPSTSNYISAFGYDEHYDWVFLPIECAGNSSIPVGDYSWTTNGFDGIHAAIIGGSWYSKENAGLFAYGFDQDVNTSLRSIGANVMFIPDEDSIYEQNIEKWKQVYTKG